MSTRSGKRIHSAVHESIVNIEAELTLKSERKTRNRRVKENDGQLESFIPKLKKRQNYVSYPGEDVVTAAANVIEAKPTRRVRRNTLKDHNVDVPPETDDECRKAVRQTRRTKKFAETTVEDLATSDSAPCPVEVEIPNGKVVNKKNKKTKKKSNTGFENGESDQVVKKSKKNKKKGKRSNSKVVEDVKNVLNKSNMSADSFHSAAGSPVRDNQVENGGQDMEVEETTPKPKCSQSNTTFEKNETSYGSPVLNNTFDKVKLKSNSKDATFDKTENVSFSTRSNSTFDKESKESNGNLNKTFEKSSSDLSTNLNNSFDKETRKSKNTTFDHIDPSSISITSEISNTASSEKLNTTFEKKDTSVTKKQSTRRKSSLRETEKVSKSTRLSEFDKLQCNGSSEKLNSTFEIEPSPRKSLRSHTSTEKEDSITVTHNTIEKPATLSKSISLNSTFDKNTKLDSTFDKNLSSSMKSSLTSDDGTINITFDKSDNSCISITSDDSKTENIVNTTPLLIESSLDDSEITESSKENLIVSKEPAEVVKPPVTPLKKEGTFTKDGPEPIIMSPKPKISSENSPTKQQLLASPGFTPFPNRSSTKEKSVLNITRSIEKSVRRSSLADMVPRQTKVMFCSPANNPAVVMQQKRKVIKSSLKGSNKSFVFDDSVTASSQPAARKRSFTHNDADDTRAKRKRLGDDLQQSVDRLSRPRTASATVPATIPNQPTPSKKPVTPSKTRSDGKSRTKLPNFAALHQKQFARMESLDECQERKARRARQLMTPNGALAVLERNSPRGTSVEPQKVIKEPSKKPVTPSKTPKVPTLESLRPGYTRFGFKMNYDVNPFSIPSKTEVKPKENRPNRLKKQVLPLPSLNGATSVRREAAKQTVMREKSFTSLSSRRDEKRKENRTIIKGVRTNRRFDLQMKMRNIDLSRF